MVSPFEKQEFNQSPWIISTEWVLNEHDLGNLLSVPAPSPLLSGWR